MGEGQAFRQDSVFSGLEVRNSMAESGVLGAKHEYMDLWYLPHTLDLKVEKSILLLGLLHDLVVSCFLF